MGSHSGNSATVTEPPNGVWEPGKHYYRIWHTVFEVDRKYIPIKGIGRGAYGVVCSAVNRETGEKVAIKKICDVFENRLDSLRTLREVRLLRQSRHENVIGLKDVMIPPLHAGLFKDVYLVYELMDTDLNRIIRSSQPLSNDHAKYFLFQVCVLSRIENGVLSMEYVKSERNLADPLIKGLNRKLVLETSRGMGLKPIG